MGSKFEYSRSPLAQPKIIYQGYIIFGTATSTIGRLKKSLPLKPRYSNIAMKWNKSHNFIYMAGMFKVVIMLGNLNKR